MRQSTINEMKLTEEDYRSLSTHLFREALLLDQGHFDRWLGTISPKIRYQLKAPTVANWRSSDKTLPPEIILMDETFGTLTTRVEQLSNHSYTVAENPRSITRRHVSNVIIELGSETGTMQVQSNVLIYRSRGRQVEPHILSLSRADVFERQDGIYRLTTRHATLDSSVIMSRNISGIF